MWGMFWGAEAFNQPLSSFDTSAVTDVSVPLCRVRLDETPNSDSLFLPNFLSDEMDVQLCICLQSTTVII